MKTLGLIGGLSWESTAIYYRLLNEMAKARLGGLASAQLLVWSFEFAEVAALQREGQWDRLTAMMIDAARRLERGGADALVICSNTMHKMAPPIEQAVNLPLIHIADATAAEINERGCKRPLLLGTRFAMEEDYYRARLLERGVAAVIPAEPGRLSLQRIIFDELCQGIVSPDSKAALTRIVVDARRDDGVDGIILGCTELGMILNQADFDIPVFDTATLHAETAMRFAMPAA